MLKYFYIISSFVLILNCKSNQRKDQKNIQRNKFSVENQKMITNDDSEQASTLDEGESQITKRATGEEEVLSTLGEESLGSQTTTENSAEQTDQREDAEGRDIVSDSNIDAQNSEVDVQATFDDRGFCAKAGTNCCSWSDGVCGWCSGFNEWDSTWRDEGQAKLDCTGKCEGQWCESPGDGCEEISLSDQKNCGSQSSETQASSSESVSDTIHLPLKITQYNESKEPTEELVKLVLDYNWGWAEQDSTSGVFSTWVKDYEDYETSYNTSQPDEKSLKMDFFPGAGVRWYVLEDNDNYKLWNLLGQEITYTVDVSTLKCGTNGAIYFSEMSNKNDLVGLKAGPRWGGGYCDAQCPTDLKSWECNSVDSDCAALKGRCCNEFDIWEANSQANAFTTHTCTDEKGGVERGPFDGVKGGRCDSAGCDVNMYRHGYLDFYGNDPEVSDSFKVNTSQLMTVTTQFITNSDGQLKEVRRVYYQNIGGKLTAIKVEEDHQKYEESYLHDDFCRDIPNYEEGQYDYYSPIIVDSEKSMLASMGESFTPTPVENPDTGMVLVLSVWNDSATNMKWLDGTLGTGEGSVRGPCDNDLSSQCTEENPCSVTVSDIKYGPIGTTVTLD
ncbi:MAG: hypothetical protein CMP11_08315 [Zetaproteobacteria bacterium]|nr:hypothetical protein [Pseudobdellovibrionaceae bacterium]